MDDINSKAAVVRRSARVERIMRKKEPQLVERNKKALILKGHQTSQVIIDVLRDIALLLKPNCHTLGRKNDVLPFEDANSLEFLTGKNDCALFVLGSHTKKRPHNLIIGRTFDGHILDIIELGVDIMKSIAGFTGSKKAVGAKPLLAFVGQQWETDALFSRLQNLLVDLFRGEKLEKLSLQGIDHVISCSVADGVVYIRGYSVAFKKSGTKIPNVKLFPMGPFLNLTVRRNQLASDDMWKAACAQPKNARPPKVKNVSETVLGEKVGRIHMKPQNLDKMGGRRVAALRSNLRGAGGKAEGAVAKKRQAEGSDTEKMVKNKRLRRAA